MEILKIGITGTVGAGKTSFVQTISEIDPVDTERRVTDETALLKSTTTVALDFGRLTLNSGQVLYLYGTPGQTRFDFMWDIIIESVHAYIFLVDAHRPQDFRASRRLLNYMKQKVKIPMIIGLTHTDCDGAWEAEDLAIALGLLPRRNRPLIVSLNATEAHSVAQSLIVLVEQLLKASVF